MPIVVKNKIYCVIYYNFPHTSVTYANEVTRSRQQDGQRMLLPCYAYMYVPYAQMGWQPEYAALATRWAAEDQAFYCHCKAQCRKWRFYTLSLQSIIRKFFYWHVLLFTTTITFTPAYLGPDFQNFLRRSQENLRKMTKVTKMLRKSYDDADFQNFLRKA